MRIAGVCFIAVVLLSACAVFVLASCGYFEPEPEPERVPDVSVVEALGFESDVTEMDRMRAVETMVYQNFDRLYDVETELEYYQSQTGDTSTALLGMSEREVSLLSEIDRRFAEYGAGLSTVISESRATQRSLTSVSSGMGKGWSDSAEQVGALHRWLEDVSSELGSVSASLAAEIERLGVDLGGQSEQTAALLLGLEAVSLEIAGTADAVLVLSELLGRLDVVLSGQAAAVAQLDTSQSGLDARLELLEGETTLLDYELTEWAASSAARITANEAEAYKLNGSQREQV